MKTEQDKRRDKMMRINRQVNVDVYFEQQPPTQDIKYYTPTPSNINKFYAVNKPANVNDLM